MRRSDLGQSRRGQGLIRVTRPGWRRDHAESM